PDPPPRLTLCTTFRMLHHHLLGCLRPPQSFEGQGAIVCGRCGSFVVFCLARDLLGLPEGSYSLLVSPLLSKSLTKLIERTLLLLPIAHLLCGSNSKSVQGFRF